MEDDNSDDETFIEVDRQSITTNSDNNDDFYSSDEESGTCKQLFENCFKYDYKEELFALLKIQVPACLTAFFQFFLQTVSIIMSGHLSTEEMDAVALACSIINVGGICIGAGLSSACDTFFAQTYGSHNKKRVGIFVQRSLLAMYMTLMFVYCFYLNIRYLLPLLGQDLTVSEMTVQYLIILMPGLFFDYTFMVISRYLQIQNMLISPLVCAFLANVINVVSQYVSIVLFGSRYLATAYCQVGSMFFMTSSLILYIVISKVYKDTWNGWSLEALYDVGKFMKIGVPGIMLFLIEMGSFEVGIFVMGSVGTVQLAAQAIILTCATIAYMPCIGNSVAVAIRVGEQIGARNINGAKHSYKVALSLTFAIAIFLTIFFACLTHEIPHWFSKDPEVIKVTSIGLRAYTVFPFVDGVSATTIGVLKGCGKQLLGATGNIIAYIIIGLPVGIPLALHTSLQVSGMWIGLFIGVFVECILLLLFIARLDWSKEVRKASKRYNINAKPICTAAINCNDNKQHISVVEIESNEPRLPPLKPILQWRLLNVTIIVILLSASVVSYWMQIPLVDLSHVCHLSDTINSTSYKNSTIACPESGEVYN